MRSGSMVLAGVSVVAAIGASAIAVAHRQFRRATDADVRRLFSDATTAVGREALDARWHTLPAPIQRHLHYAITGAAPPIRTARLRHAGTFRTGPGQEWSAIAGEQYFSVSHPGFVWFASLRVAPLIWIQARDRLIGGRGHMLVKPLSAFAIADASGSEIDQGAALRWLAESLWFPYALASDAVAWEGIDAHSARASLRGDSAPARATFEIDPAGRIVRMAAERYRDIGGGHSVLSKWSGRYRDYVEVGGFRVPSSVEVTWDLAEGPFSYARFIVTTLEYNVSGPF